MCGIIKEHFERVRKIADRAYTQEEILVEDTTGEDLTLTLRPLPIARLRRFMKAWGKFGSIGESPTNNSDDVNDEVYDIYINCSGIALEKQLKDKVDTLFKADRTLSKPYREYLEEILDIETIFKVIEVCGGIKLNDPKLMEAAAEAAAMEAADQREAGMN